MSDLLNDRAKTHGDYYRTSMMAQELKDAMRRGVNWKSLDDMQRETLEMVATKIGRILSGNPHEVDHWKDIAGYAQLIVNACTACADDPTRRPGADNPATPAPVPPTFVVTGKAKQP